MTDLLRLAVPAPNEVHVWWIDLNATPDGADDLLSSDERARAARFHRRRDRGRWTNARVAVRQILAGYLGLPPQEVRFTAGIPEAVPIPSSPRILGEEGGWASSNSAKPALANDPRLRFNLAHAGDRAVLAAAWEREVGVDLEPIDAGLDLSPLLTAACTPAEIARVEALPPELRIHAFLTLWTVKEAYLKALGVGMFREPRALEIEFFDDGRLLVHDADEGGGPPGWDVRRLDAGHGWVAALAVAGSAPTLIAFDWPRRD